MKKKRNVRFSSEGIELELKRIRYAQRYRETLRSTIFTLITVAAIVVIVTKNV